MTVDATHTYNPADTFVLRSNGHLSILDTVFVSKRSRRAVYATITHGSHTLLWWVASSGAMTELARISWEYEVRVTSAGDGSLRNGNKPTKRFSMLTFGGKMVRTDDFLQKGKGWFSSDGTRTFIAINTEYKWKSGLEHAGINDSQPTGNRNGAYDEAWKVWRCVSARPDPNNASPKVVPWLFPSEPHFHGRSMEGVGDIMASTHAIPEPAGSSEPSLFPLPNSSSPNFTFDHQRQDQSASSIIRPTMLPTLSAPAASNVLARFVPPQQGIVHPEISLFPPVLVSTSDVGQGPRVLEYLLVSVVLLAASKGEWKHVQSSIDATSLQAVFAAEAVGDVPPYTPGARNASTPRVPMAIRNRTNSGRSRRCEEYVAGEEEHPSANQLAGDSDCMPSLPRRSTHRQSRSNPLNMFPTSHRNLGTAASCGNRAHPTDPEHGTQRPLVSRRPATADPTPAGDGIFTRRRPSSQVVNAAPVLTQGRRHRLSTAGGIPSRPISSPPPMYA